ncbi:MAG: ATP-binding protein [Candidatus Acidiferrales bacterium]
MSAYAQPAMPSAREQFAAEYRAALARFLSGAGEAALTEAYELGRRGISSGMGVLEMVLLHQSAVEGIAPDSLSSAPSAAWRAAAAEFLIESLTPHEMAYRGFQEASLAMRRMNDLLEQQARRIAHAIHDESGQLLVLVHLTMDRLRQELPPQWHERCDEVLELLKRIGTEMRDFSHELRPTMLDDLGLLPALEFLAARISNKGTPKVELQCGPLPRRLPAEMEATVYRAVQEALANVVRHANAQNLRIDLRSDGHALVCRIEDDGEGFDVAAVLGSKGQRGLGLIGMGEQLDMIGATLQIKSQAGEGTALVISVPWEVASGDTNLFGR